MPESKQQIRFQWIKPIVDKQITITDVLRVCPFSERTIKYWLTRYRKDGIKDYLIYLLNHILHLIKQTNGLKVK